MSLDINKLKDGECIIDGFTRKIVDFDVHYNDSQNNVPQLPETLINKDIVFIINNGIDPSTGSISTGNVTGYKCRLEKYTKMIKTLNGDTPNYNWVAYVPLNNENDINHIKLKLI